MTQDNFLHLITDVADTPGYTETNIYDYLWSIVRHPIAPASISSFMTGSTKAIEPSQFSYDYVERLHRLLNERGHCPE